MIMTKAFTPVDLLSYTFILTQVSEEYGGAKTAYVYDLLQRTAMAKALERGEKDLRPFLNALDREVLKEAKMKVETQLQTEGRDEARRKGAKDWGRESTSAASGKGGKEWRGEKGGREWERESGKGGRSGKYGKIKEEPDGDHERRGRSRRRRPSRSRNRAQGGAGHKARDRRDGKQWGQQR